MIIPAYNTIYSRVNTSGAASSFEYTPIDNNYSMEFDGTNYIDTGVIDLGTTYTLSFWFKNSVASTTVSMLGKTDYYLALGHSLGLYWSFTNSASASFRAAITGTEITNAMGDTANWHHVVLVRKPATNTFANYSDLEVFLDGTSIYSLADKYTATLPLDNFGIIGSDGTQTYGYSGNIDEVAAWNSVLSEGTIEAIYNTTNDNPGKAADLSETPEGAPTAWYRFE